VEALAAHEVPVRPVVLPPRAYRAEAHAIRDAALATDASIIHTHGYRTDVVTALFGVSSVSRIVSTAHGFTGGDWKNRLYQRLECAAWRRCDAVIAVSAPLVEALERRGIDRGRIHFVPNAARNSVARMTREEARIQLGIGSSAHAIGWVGRLSSEKGPDVIIDAVARLKDSRVELHIVGDGRLRETLVSRAASLGIADRVRWQGSIDNAARLYSAFDVFVLSSRTEGTPMVLLEAMGANVPVVATAVGGIPDVLAGNSGLLVRAEDPDALASAIAAVLDDPVAASARSERAAAILQEEYSVERWIARHEELYAAVMSTPQGEGTRWSS
jgi:glycosyltransferase involved in cell wall biosynthesis